jgi:hypothetical protein
MAKKKVELEAYYEEEVVSENCLLVVFDVAKLISEMHQHKIKPSLAGTQRKRC